MRKQLIKTALLLGAVSCGGNAVTETSYEACYDELRLYETEYGSKEGKNKHTPQDRVSYLNALKPQCRELDLSIAYKSQALIESGRYKEGLDEIERGIERGIKPVGNLLNTKANSLRVLKSSGVDLDITYESIIGIYQQALEKENEVEPMIHLGWAETALLDGRLKEAMHHLEVGADLKPDISRFFSLGAVVTTQMGEYEATLRMIKIAVQKGEKNYFSEPDAVLAIATALCKLGRNDEAHPIVAQAQQMGGKEFMKLPDMVKAARMVLDCPASRKSQKIDKGQ